MNKIICMVVAVLWTAFALGTDAVDFVIEDGEIIGINGACPETLVIPEGVRGIGANAFCHDKVDVGKMKSICIASSVTNIGEAAFRGCTNVTEVIFPSGSLLQTIDAYAFQSCESLSAFVLPDGVQEIGGLAFWGCDSLQELRIPASVREIGDRALIRCRNMSRIEVDPDNTRYKSVDGVLYDRSGSRMITCPAGKEGTLTIEDGVYFLDTEACSGCARLTGVMLPSGLMDVSYGAFEGCPCLKSITLPSSVEYIEMYAFFGCTALEAVNIPTSVRWVGHSAFAMCESLTNYWNDGVLIIDGVVVDCDYYKNTPACLPDGCRLIAEAAFMSADFLPSVIVPETVRSVGEDAFAQCENLSSVTYLGDAPKVMQSSWGEGTSVYRRSISVTNFVRCGSCGWNREDGCDTLPELWPVGDGDARPIFYNENLPPLRLPDGLNYTEQVGDYTWTFKIENGEAVIGTYNERGEAINDYGEVRAVNPTPFGEVEIPSRLGGCSVVGIDDYALQYVPEATGVVFPETIRRIGAWAFNAWWSVPSVELPHFLEKIGEYAFVNCMELEGVVIPATVRHVGEGLFSNCRSLSCVVVEDGNDWYCSKDGALYDWCKETVLFYPRDLPIEMPCTLCRIGDSAYEFNDATAGMAIVIPPNVTDIGKGAFYGCHLAKISLPDGLRTIDAQAFGYNDLKYVEIPASVVSLGSDMFMGSESLCGVFFAGDAPVASELLYQGAPENLTNFVRRGTAGWRGWTEGGLPERWPRCEIGDERDFSRPVCEWTFYPEIAHMVYYVAKQGSDANNGLSKDNAFGTIQHAVDVAEDDVEILVGDGAYGPVSVGAKRLKISSLNGASQTVIDGGGTNRCAALGDMEHGSTLSGFTLRNGFVGSVDNVGGGVEGGTLIGCVISNCLVGKIDYAYGGGAYCSKLINCLVVGNVAEGRYGAYGAGVASCVLHGCTVANNILQSDVEAYGAGAYCGDAYNTILTGNRTLLNGEKPCEDDANGGFGDAASCWIGSSLCYSPLEDEKQYHGAPRFMDPERGDYRLCRNSPCLDCGDDRYVTGDLDLAGSDRIQGESVDIGAYEGGFWGHAGIPRGVTATTNWANGVCVSWREVPTAEKYVVYRSLTPSLFDMAKIAEVSSCCFNDHDVSIGRSYYYWVCAVNEQGSGDLSDTAVGQCVEPHVFYVDEKAGWSPYEDWGMGFADGSAKCPFEFIQYASEVAVPGDIVRVAPGEYECLIDKPLIIVADEGSENTFVSNVLLDDWESACEDRVTLRGFSICGGFDCVARNANLDKCLIAGCSSGDCLFSNCELTHCTVVGNAFYYAWQGTDFDEAFPGIENRLFDECKLTDCIVWGNEGEENDLEDPVFVSGRFGDYRLRMASPWVKGGKATRGCFDEVVDGFVITATKEGGGQVDRKYAVVPDGGSVTFATSGAHPVDHYEVNGVYAAGAPSYTFTNVRSDATLKAVFKRLVFHVNANSGDDGNDGLSSSNALKNLQVAIDLSRDGDEVVVADGVYEPISTLNRRIVIRSLNGPENTVIDAHGTGTCALLGGMEELPEEGEPLPYGLYWMGTNTFLRGFTLRNGESVWGAGVTAGTVEYCLIEGNVAQASSYGAAGPNGIGGGALFSVLKHCTVVGNSACGAETWNGYEGGEGGGAYGCTLSECILIGNEASCSGQDIFDSTFDGRCYIDYMADLDDEDLEWSLTEDPCFADYENGDYRLRIDSPYVVGGKTVIGCFSDPYDPMARPRCRVTFDLDGGRFDQVASGSLVNDVFEEAKGVAESLHIPLVVIWNNDNCVYCDRLKSACADLEVMKWMDARQYVFVSVTGAGSADAAAAKEFAKNTQGKYPYVAVYWLRDGEDAVKETFPGRFDGDIANGFMDAVDAITKGVCMKGIAVMENPRIVDQGTAVGMLPSARRDGFTFLGWNVDGHKLSPETIVNADMTVKAIWEQSGHDPAQQGVIVPAEITGGKEIVVDESWPTSLDAQFGAGTSAAFVEKFGSDLSAALLKPTGKKNAAGEEMYVWQDYVAGTDPTDQKSQFTAKIEMVDGEPVVVWSPKLSEAEAAKRIYTIYGKRTLEGSHGGEPRTIEPWTPVETSAQGGWRFFKVGVEMR